jgi:hypothetical protein
MLNTIRAAVEQTLSLIHCTYKGHSKRIVEIQYPWVITRCDKCQKEYYAYQDMFIQKHPKL